MKRIFAILIVMLLFTSCFDNKAHNCEELKSTMKITKISNFSIDPGFLEIKVDSVAINTYCIYTVTFINANIVGENDFSFIDTIGKYNVGDKFPKIK